MLINKEWDFETAVNEISNVYRPGGKTTGPLRNRQVESWGQIVGKTRAVTEFDDAIKRYGSLSAFGREYSVTVPILRHFREFFESLPDDQVAKATSESNVGMIKAFISYSWDNDDHKNWVRELATRLRGDGVDVTLDQWHLVPGDQLPEFMERAVRESDYVLIVCTHKYRERSNNRQGGVGYEGDIITAEFMATRNQRKFIPILRQQSWGESAPNWLSGKYYIDLSSSPYPQKYYDDLLTTLLGTREKAPPIKTTPKVETPDKTASQFTNIVSSVDFDEIVITGVIVDQISTPINDGSRGSALYKIPFRLSKRPPSEWAELFVQNWDHPSRFSTMHRPGIASVVGDTVILDGTTIEEVKDYHRDTLVLVIQETNKVYKEFIERKRKAIEREQQQAKAHKHKVEDISNQIKFHDD
ncbi:MAG: TIR domain-containing protein [Nitrosomonas sp. PRO4]|nr:TIR domain-containing protein [Nitrosomonas sp. PRO4]